MHILVRCPDQFEIFPLLNHFESSPRCLSSNHLLQLLLFLHPIHFPISSNYPPQLTQNPGNKRRRSPLRPILPLCTLPRLRPPIRRAHRLRRPPSHPTLLDRQSALSRQIHQTDLLPARASHSPRRSSIQHRHHTQPALTRELDLRRMDTRGQHTRILRANRTLSLFRETRENRSRHLGSELREE